MKPIAVLLTAAFSLLPAFAELKSGPALPHKLVKDWAQLPKGWNFGECSGVAVDKQDNVWVFNRGPHGIIQFDKHGNMLQAWGDGTIKWSHGIRVDGEGNVWAVDQKGHVVIKYNPAGRVQMVLGNRQGTPGDNEAREGFSEPTGVTFAPNGDLFVSDGYVNSRVVKIGRNGDYITHWGKKGNGDGEFTIVHDIALDSRGKLYVADRTNSRIQMFDMDGKFLGKWTDIGQPWGLAYSAKEDALYVADGLNNRVVKLDMTGKILGQFGSYGAAPGRLNFAHNIAVDSEGSVYVVEIKNWRVQKWTQK